jgi:uncharacterized membrane protein
MAKKASLRIVRISRAHPRLMTSIAVGVAAYALLTMMAGQLALTTRLLAAWDVGVLLYLVWLATMMAGSKQTDIAKHADAQDEGEFGILILTVIAAMASLAAIFVEMAATDRTGARYGFEVALAILTVVFSWAFIHSIFALHYAYEYYDDAECAGGLKFPDDDKPDYWDFVYFAFVLGMTFQVSDVAITAKRIRRVATVHGVLAFFYTTAVVALTVNLAANFMQK